MKEPDATLNDLYAQNESIIRHLERMNKNLYYIREAVYGQTREESGEPYANPKHGSWGMVDSEQIESLEAVLQEIADSLGKR